MARGRNSNKGPVGGVDLSLIPEEELSALREQAKIKVGKERLAEAREAAIAAFVEEERRATSKLPEHEMVDIYIDLPEFCDRLIIDSKVFLFGHTYTVSRPQADSMLEMMARTFDHQLEIDGKSKFGHESRRIGLSGKRGQYLTAV